MVGKRYDIMTSSLSDFDFDPSFDSLMTDGSTTVTGTAVQFLVEVCRFENVIPGNVNLMIPAVEKQYIRSQPLLNILICHLSGRFPRDPQVVPNRLNILIFQGLFLANSDL